MDVQNVYLDISENFAFFSAGVEPSLLVLRQFIGLL
jgi:hypothetical protein